MEAVLQDEINKRLTLNLLIQGCAQHAFLTSHYLVRDELACISAKLIPAYDKFALLCGLQYWYGLSVLTNGSPRRFWERVACGQQTFGQHNLLRRHGAMLAEANRAYTLNRARTKGIRVVPVLFSFQVVALAKRIPIVERPHCDRLVALAKKVIHQTWEIPFDQLEGELTQKVEFGSLSKPHTLQAVTLRKSAVGYGGVVRSDGQFCVVGRAITWPLLAHELTKGTAELVCLHGLNTLDDGSYGRVMAATDRIEFEPWMLQAGPELWRRLLAVLPIGESQAHILMQLARMAPRELEGLMLSVVEDTDRSRVLLGRLFDSHDALRGE